MYRIFRGRLFAFSLIEVMVALLVVAIIVVALAPVITKRMQRDIVGRSRISTSCSSLFPEGYCGMCYLNPKSCIVCTKVCSSDEFQNVSECSCVKCSVHHNDSSCVRCNSKYCVQCKQGYYLDGNNRCTICPKGYYCYQDNSNGINGDGGTSIKKPCPKGYAAPNEGMSACVACAKSTSGVQGSVAVNEGSVNCTLCTNGYYASSSAQAVSCNKCPKGYYCPNGKIIPCAKGSSNNQTGRYTSCVLCNKSTSSVQGGVATTTAMTSCSVCNNGYYASTQGQTTNCIKCPSGYYCPDGKLIACAKGYYCPQGSSSQKACSAGKYSSSANASSCSTCPKGTYSNTGATSCISCPKGSYSSNSGSSSCTKCAKGYYSSNTGSTSCTKCSAGYYSNTGASSCTKCASGYYSNSGASSCSKCSDKFEHCVECSNSKCTKCEDGYEPSEDGTECKKKGCPDKTVEIEAGGKKLCVTQYNMGDDAAFPLTGVEASTVGNYCRNSEEKCCWKGATSNRCDSKNGKYSGCNRTVCTLYAAKVLCSNLKYDNRNWRLPTSNELSYFNSYSMGKGSEGLMLCDYYSYDRLHSAGCYNNGENECLRLVNGLTGCTPYQVWSSSCAFRLKNDSWNIGTCADSNAASIRCVSELDE